jgi:hypothetical protein
MSRILLLATAVALGGCVSTETYTTPDGKPALVTYCGGDFKQMTDCHAEARKQCGGNYTVLAEREAPRSAGPKGRYVNFQCGA